MKEKIYATLSNIVDPEVGFDIVSLGLIYDAACDENGKAKVTMTLSTRSCPLHEMILVRDRPRVGACVEYRDGERRGEGGAGGK